VAWFVLNSQAETDVVSFFVIGRLADRSTSDAYSQAVSEQSAALAREPQPASPVPDDERDRLLLAACERAAQRGRRLLLAVDGLDEDQGARPRSGWVSIASALPTHPHYALRVVVTSRRSWDVPADVTGDHPLVRCEPRYLTTYSHATDLLDRAKLEVTEALGDDELDADIVVFAAVASDGLSAAELAQLTGQLQRRVQAKLSGAFGRTLLATTVDSMLRAAAGPRPGAAGRTPSTPGDPGAAASGRRRGRARQRTCAGRRVPTTDLRRGQPLRAAATRG